MGTLTIGQVAEQVGVKASAIRYYEEVGLLPAPARVSGQRRYDDGVLRTLTLIRGAQRAGFTIAEIRTLLHGFPEGTAPAERWRDLAGRKLSEVDELIEQARETRWLLERALRCECASLDECAPTDDHDAARLLIAASGERSAPPR